jgi:hypothetical protein
MIAFIAGLVVGANLGLLVMAVMQVSSLGDEK